MRKWRQKGSLKNKGPMQKQPYGFLCETIEWEWLPSIEIPCVHSNWCLVSMIKVVMGLNPKKMI